jgi:transposase
VVAYLGDLEESVLEGVWQGAEGKGASYQKQLFKEVDPEWVKVDISGIRVERTREFGGVWLGLQMVEKLGLGAFFKDVMEQGHEEVDWSAMGLVLVLCRLCNPSSELYIAEHFYERTALSDLLGVPCEKVNDDRLYRALDKVLPHKGKLETYLKERMGELFKLDYDLLLYDMTSTYFEGECIGNPDAKRGYSRDHRSDCKQVCIALVVSKGGIPLGYEVFEGNRSDVKTVEEIVEVMESRYGKANRVWVMDRGMVSEKNVRFLKEGGRRYLLGTPKSQLRYFERELMEDNWDEIREGIEVKLCPSPEGEEVFILCRSADRRNKEKGIHDRFERRIEEGLQQIAQSCQKRKQKVALIERRVGRLLGRNTRAAGLFKAEVYARQDGSAGLRWTKTEQWRDWARLTEGCYLLRSNILDWSAQDLWETYIQLTEAETAFRIHKQDLSIRPIWHQKKERVQAHILVCFLSYVLWKTLAQICKKAGLGDEPRKVLDELSQIHSVDVVLPTTNGIEIRKRCVTQPTVHQAILLDRLKLHLPKQLAIHEI